MGNTEQDQADAHHGAGGFDLARPAGGDHAAFFHGHQTHTGHRKFPQQHHSQYPTCHGTFLHEPAKRRHHKAFIRQRVHKFTEIGDLVIVTGDVAIQQVGQAGQDKHAQRHIAAARKAPI